MKAAKRAAALASVAVLVLVLGVLTASEPPRVVFSLFAAIALHEGGHVVAIKAAGLPLTGVIPLPFGAMLDTGARICPYPTEAAVYLAGPMASLAGAAVAALGADAQKTNVAFCFAILSAGLGCFNLLPLPGLDGAGALRSLLLYTMPDMYAAERAARVVEAVFSLLFWLAAGAVWLAFDTGAYPLALSVFFLLRLLCG